MLLQANIPPWEIWATMFTMVAPLYAHAAYMLWKRFQTEQNTSAISEQGENIAQNTEEIHEIRQTLVEMNYELKLVQNDLQVIHDNTTEQNHCGSEHCRWCEKHDEDE